MKIQIRNNLKEPENYLGPHDLICGKIYKIIGPNYIEDYNHYYMIVENLSEKLLINLSNHRFFSFKLGNIAESYLYKEVNYELNVEE